jgi:hypothetical protein
VGCKHNNYLEVLKTGHIKIFYPNRLPEDVPPDESCDLDVADQGDHTLDHVAKMFRLTRERIRQIETTALNKILRDINAEEAP